MHCIERQRPVLTFFVCAQIFVSFFFVFLNFVFLNFVASILDAIFFIHYFHYFYYYYFSFSSWGDALQAAPAPCAHFLCMSFSLVLLPLFYISLFFLLLQLLFPSFLTLLFFRHPAIQTRGPHHRRGAKALRTAYR